MTKAKLHEVLAVEGSLENQAMKVVGDLSTTFEKKRHLFEERRTLFTPSGEGQPSTVEAQSDIQTTVTKELAWVGAHIAKALDASFQVADANCRARADVVLDDDAQTVLLKDVPVTNLLELEKRIAAIQALVTAVPTLDPAKGFSLDPQRGGRIFKARDVTKTRTKKNVKVIVKYEATKEHPAQTELLTVDEPVGSLHEQEWSGLITPAEKSEMLARVEMVARAVRAARSRANAIEVDTDKKIGRTLVQFIFEGRS